MSLTLAIPYFSPKDYMCFTLTITLLCLVGKEKCLRNFILWGAIKKNINNVYILLHVLAADGGILKLLCKYHQHPNSSAKSSDGNKGSLNLPPKTQGKKGIDNKPFNFYSWKSAEICGSFSHQCQWQ